MVDQSRVSDQRQGEEGIQVRRQQRQPAWYVGVRRATHRRIGLCGVPEPKQRRSVCIGGPPDVQ